MTPFVGVEDRQKKAIPQKRNFQIKIILYAMGKNNMKIKLAHIQRQKNNLLIEEKVNLREITKYVLNYYNRRINDNENQIILF